MGLMGMSAIVAGGANTLEAAVPALGNLKIGNERYIASSEVRVDPLKNHSLGCGFFLVN